MLVHLSFPWKIRNLKKMKNNQNEVVLRQCKSLLLDEDFEQLQQLSQSEANMMEILGVSQKEIRHSNMLSWMLNPNESHGLGDLILKGFLKLYFKENNYADLGHANSLSVFDFVSASFSDLEVKREYRNIDLLLISPKNNLVIVIENKIFSKEIEYTNKKFSSQLEKYKSIVDEEFASFEKVFFFLSLHEQSVSDSMSEYYTCVTYEYIATILQKLLHNKNKSLPDNVRFILQQYLVTLYSLMNNHPEIEALATKLYRKYRSVFDLVYKYKGNGVSDTMYKVMQKYPLFEISKNVRDWIDYQPEWLSDFSQKLIDRGLHTLDVPLENNRILHFNFGIKPKEIIVGFCVGWTTDIKTRKNIEDEAVKTAKKRFIQDLRTYPLFEKSHDPEKKMAGSHVVWKKTIMKVNTQEIEDMDNFATEFEEKLQQFMKKDLVKIKDILEQVL